jgi:hypothetical protein
MLTRLIRLVAAFWHRWVSTDRTMQRILLIGLAGILGSIAIGSMWGISHPTHPRPRPSASPSPSIATPTPVPPPTITPPTTPPAATTPPAGPPPTTLPPVTTPTSANDLAPGDDPAPAPGRVVTPGAYCSPEGATGYSRSGDVEVCRRSATDSHLRWRAA